VVDLVDKLGRAWLLRLDDFSHSRKPAWSKGFLIKNRQARGLIPFVASVLYSLRYDIVRFTDQIPATWLEPRDGDSASVRVGAVLLRMLMKRWKMKDVKSYVEALVDYTRINRNSEVTSAPIIAHLLDHSQVDTELRISFLKGICDKLTDSGSEALLGLLRAALDARRSRLAGIEEWKRLELPDQLLELANERDDHAGKVHSRKRKT
jgi:hypothetical protein